MLEVAYVSRVMSKNFRKEGQPEKERIAEITGIELEKVSEAIESHYTLILVSSPYCRDVRSQQY